MTISGQLHGHNPSNRDGTPYDRAYAMGLSAEGSCNSVFNFFIQDRLPTWVSLENKNLVNFMGVFYEWLKCENDFGELEVLQDLDVTEDSFIKLIKNTYAEGFPDKLVKYVPYDGEDGAARQLGGIVEDILIDFINPSESKLDVRNFLHFVKDFYHMKSLEEVYTFFFRVFFDSDIDISYPKLRVLRLSDSPYRGASAGSTGAICDYSGMTYVDDDGTVGRTGECWEISGAGQENDGFVPCWNPGSPEAMSNPLIYPPCTKQDCAPGSPCGVYYWDELGTLSGYSVIQDSKIWQDYSYLLDSPIPFNTYWPYVKKLIHPAGLFAAGNYTIWDEFPMPGFTGDVFPTETPIIGNYTPYRFFDTINLRDNQLDVDLYPCGYNPYLSGGTYTDTHIQDGGGLWYKDTAGTTAHQPRSATGEFVPMGLTSERGHITGGTAAGNLNISFFRIYHHPNSWTEQVPSGASFGDIGLGEFYFLTGINNNSSPNDPAGSSAGCGF